MLGQVCGKVRLCSLSCMYRLRKRRPSTPSRCSAPRFQYGLAHDWGSRSRLNVVLPTILQSIGCVAHSSANASSLLCCGPLPAWRADASTLSPLPATLRSVIKVVLRPQHHFSLHPALFVSVSLQPGARKRPDARTMLNLKHAHSDCLHSPSPLAPLQDVIDGALRSMCGDQLTSGFEQDRIKVALRCAFRLLSFLRIFHDCCGLNMCNTVGSSTAKELHLRSGTQISVREPMNAQGVYVDTQGPADRPQQRLGNLTWAAACLPSTTSPMDDCKSRLRARTPVSCPVRVSGRVE
ncbi:hypothetical protein C8Q77DRAFT_823484 [Trametes polyzona]|nr:hypothetical protein C8Q77DRAFT_823484 [Trametes polyzona]